MSNPYSSPASLPLPGGRPDATVTLRPLLCAVMSAPPGWFHRRPGRSAALQALGIGVPRDQYVRVPIVAFLVEHPGAGAILIDTGFHASATTHPRQNLGPLGAFLARGLKMDPAHTIASQCS